MNNDINEKTTYMLIYQQQFHMQKVVRKFLHTKQNKYKSKHLLKKIISNTIHRKYIKAIIKKDSIIMIYRPNSPNKRNKQVFRHKFKARRK